MTRPGGPGRGPRGMGGPGRRSVGRMGDHRWGYGPGGPPPPPPPGYGWRRPRRTMGCFTLILCALAVAVLFALGIMVLMQVRDGSWKRNCVMKRDSYFKRSRVLFPLKVAEIFKRKPSPKNLHLKSLICSFIVIYYLNNPVKTFIHEILGSEVHNIVHGVANQIKRISYFQM